MARQKRYQSIENERLRFHKYLLILYSSTEVKNVDDMFVTEFVEKN